MAQLLSRLICQMGSKSGASLETHASPVENMKVFNDPVHGHIELDVICVQVIDTPQFQRLRNLKQMGSAYHVFPGAAHNRFEHSIGVCHLASQLVKHLQKTQPELGISPSDIKCVQIAGLCHDLGHGPFSHVFDNEFMKQARPGFTWTHEVASEEMLDYLVRENDVALSEEELSFIKDLIHGAPRSDYPQASKGYLFDIVANRRNSIDVDKFDYIMRDCHNVGIKCSVDAGRLITFSRVIDNQICYHQKEAFNLYELFHIRYSLFKRIYTHKVGKAVEYMITDALLSADPVLRISSAVDDMHRYMLLDDSIVNEIERSVDPRLEDARHILARVRRRDLYRCADQIHLPVDLYDTIDASQITPLEIIRHDVVSPGSKEVALQEKDVVVEWLTLNFALKDRNPMDSVRFYSKYDTKKSIAIPKEHISSFIPNHFKEVIIKVFVRDASKAGRVQDAFRRFLKSINEQLVQQQQENVWDEEDEADEADEATQTDAEIQPAPVQVPQQMTVPAQSPAKNPPLDACFFSPRQKSPRVIGSPSVPVSKSTPIVDRSHLNPFFVEKGPSPGVAGLTSKSACSSRTGSPSKSILEPSDALTLPKNFHKIMADSPARKRKR